MPGRAEERGRGRHAPDRGGAREGGAGRPFATLFDVARRVDLKRVGKRSFEMLARAGGFDELDPNKRRVFESLDAPDRRVRGESRGAGASQTSLFGEAGEEPAPTRGCRSARLAARRSGWRRNSPLLASISRAYPTSTITSARCGRKNDLTLDEVQARAAQGPAIVKMAGTVARTEGAKVRARQPLRLRAAVGSDGAIRGDDVLRRARGQPEHLEAEPGRASQVEATMESDQLKLLGAIGRAHDVAVADAGRNRAQGLCRARRGRERCGAGSRGRAGRRGAAGRSASASWTRACPGEVELDLGGESR